MWLFKAACRFVLPVDGWFVEEEHGAYCVESSRSRVNNFPHGALTVTTQQRAVDAERRPENKKTVQVRGGRSSPNLHSSWA